MRTATGTITVAQEGRFLLAGPDGRARLFVLAPGAGLEPQDLPGIVAQGVALSVDFEPHAGQAALAHRVREIGSGRRAAAWR